MGELLRIVDIPDRPVIDERPIEELMAELLAACRRRTGETPDQFARALNDASSRCPKLLGAAVQAAEKGIHPLHADLMAHAVTRAGIDAVGVLSALLAMVR